MEILTNIGAVLNSPNETIIKVILLIGSFIEAIILMHLTLSFLEAKLNHKSKIIYITIMSISTIISRTFLPNPLNILLNYIVMIVLMYLVFKKASLKIFVSVVSSILVFGLIGFLILSPYLYLLNITSNQLETIPIYRLFYFLTMYIFSIITIFLIRARKISFMILDELDNKSKSIVIINLVFGICMLAIQMVLTIFYADTFPRIFIFFNFISLLVYICINFYSLTRVIKLSITTKQLRTSEEHNKTLHILHDNVRAFKHDFDNIITTIGGYINTNDMKGLVKYYDQIRDDCESINNLYILNPDVINDPGVYSLLATKYHKAEEHNIEINLSFFLDLNSLNMKIYEFSRILGILLDNAIEASAECDEKMINIIFRNEAGRNRSLVIIENTFNNKDVDLEEIYQKGVSQKEDHTGLGLWEVRKILKKNNNLNLHTSKSDKFFRQQFEIYY